MAGLPAAPGPHGGQARSPTLPGPPAARGPHGAAPALPGPERPQRHRPTPRHVLAARASIHPALRGRPHCGRLSAISSPGGRGAESAVRLPSPARPRPEPRERSPHGCGRGGERKERSRPGLLPLSGKGRAQHLLRFHTYSLPLFSYDVTPKSIASSTKTFGIRNLMSETCFKRKNVENIPLLSSQVV